MKLICSLLSLNLLILIAQSTPLNDNNNNSNDAIVRNKECKYDKEAWSECDPTSGLQKRVLKLKANLETSQCEPTREFTRQCGKACRYNKGTWSECLNGEKTRTDTLKQNSYSSTGSPGECETTRTTKKRCKQPSNCKYTKSEWSACENGQKIKTLTLEQGDSSECEQKKTITKQCNLKKSKNGRRASRKKTKKDRNDNKKQELLATTEESKDVKNANSSFEEPKEE